MSKSTQATFRVYHRYLGFFLVGIMSIYAISGIVLIFRTTDFFKIEKMIVKEVPVDTPKEEMGRILGIRDFKIIEESDQKIRFSQGIYDKTTSVATYQVKELPGFLRKMENLHKATTNSPLFFLNVFFGLSLLFFSISAFFMYVRTAKVLKKGIYVAVAGAVFTLILLFL